MEITERVFLFISGLLLFIGALGLLFIDPLCEFLWKIHCKRRDLYLEYLVGRYMLDSGWKIRWDKVVKGWMCISRSGFRITLKNACAYVKNHNDEKDPYYWADDFRMWNYVRKEDERK